MRIMGIDPGRMTGMVVVDLAGDVLDVVYYDEIMLEPVGYRPFNLLLSYVVQYHPDIVVIEDVVVSGPFNKDKFDQSKAFMMAYLATNTGLAGVYPTPSVAYIPPEVRKRVTLDIPEKMVVKGNHARDAFALVIAYLQQYRKELWVKLCGRSTTESSTKQTGQTN